MKKAKFSDAQIMTILRQAENGVPVSELCREHGMTEASKVAIIYPHFPHYRAPVFKALSQCQDYDFTFYHDFGGIDETISNGVADRHHFNMPTYRIGGMIWQYGAIRLSISSHVDGFIFLGNPYILSTWIAAMIARLRKKPTVFWTHGWLRKEKGIKAWVRRKFYRLADVLMLYGERARQIATAEGFNPKLIHVIYNSLDYDSQQKARKMHGSVARTSAEPEDHQHTTPYFLCVTRLVPVVELDLAIRALALLQCSARLLVVGSGPELERLEALAISLGVDVCFLGGIYEEDQLAPLFLGACAVVSPGKVGLLAMHALAYGTPVITHGDLNHQMPEVEAIQPGVTGAFFIRGDDADLARTMLMFIERDPRSKEVIKSRAIAIETIERDYTPQSQALKIASALDAAFGKEEK